MKNILLTTLIFAPFLNAQVQYQATGIGLLNGTILCSGAAVNNFNKVVGTCTIPQSQFGDPILRVAFIWSPETGMQRIDPLSGFPNSYATAINDDGVVVGYSTEGDFDGSQTRPFRWTETTGVQALQGLPDTNGSAFSVNASGFIAGTFIAESGLRKAFLWNPNGSYVRVPMVFFQATSAFVNDAGTVVGSAQTLSSGSNVGFEWSPSTGLDTFNAIPSARSTSVAAIKAQISVGNLRPLLPNAGPRGFVKIVGGATTQLSGKNCTATAINSSAQAVGSCLYPTGSYSATLWQADGTQLRIEDRVLNLPGIMLTYARAITDLGSIVVTDNSGGITYLLTPVQ